MNTLLHNIGLIGDEIPWLKEFRTAGREAFLKAGIPTPKTEAWKYTKPSRFFKQEFICKPRGSVVVPASKVSLPFDCWKICFENGVFNPTASELPEVIEVLPLIEAVMFQPQIRSKIGGLANTDNHPFTALNAAYLNEGIYLHIAAGIKLDKPIAFISHTSVEDVPFQYHLRNLIILDEDSSAEIVEYYTYSGDEKSSYLVNTINEIYLARQAELKHYKVQNEAFKAGHLGLSVVKEEAFGSYKSFCLQKGADLARNETKVILAEEGAQAEVDAAYIMNGWATIDTTTDIEHQKPYTTSSQLVKGVVGGQAKGVFQGKIHIAPNAVKTEGYQLHKAMLLSDDAEIDVKPELEIFADDVKCSHGSACGQLDSEQLFYMRSRGIGEQDARRLLIDAYLNDVIAKVDDEKIGEWIKSYVTA